MKKILTLVMSCIIGMTMLVGCGSTDSKATNGSAPKASDKITVVWYPNESGGDLEEARNEVSKIIEKATGKKVENKLTTDYSIAIEAIVNGTGGIAYMGPQGYIEANQKSKKVQPLVVSSGKSGTLDDAVYYSWLAVPKDKAEEYKKNGKYVLDNIQGKKMSFVSNSSTSGFKIPTTSIISYFSKQDKWKNLTTEDLMQGGSDKFFTEVLYGGSHQGSAVNVLSGKADVGAFCDTTLVNYVDASSGKFNEVGTTYKVKADAAEPFNTLKGKEFTAIASTPVLNSPFAINTDVINVEDQKKLVDAFTSEEVANNQKIFVKKDSGVKGFFAKEGKEKFLKVEDAWFNPIRNISK